MAIVCNRLDITGDVSERTPLIVIKEIMLAHHIVWEENRTDPNYIRGCIKSIYTYPAYRVDIPLSTNGRNTLKRYLDVSDEEWSNEELIQVYQIWNDIISRISNGIPIEYIGRPTRSCPKSLNACFLYRICNEKGIELPFNISLDNLAVIAKLSEGGNV